MKKLQWKTKHNNDFNKEKDFLATVLIENGVNKEKIQDFLYPSKKFIHDPFLLKNMREAVQMVKSHISNGAKILMKVDPDVDGFCSASEMTLFLKELNPNVNIVHIFSTEKSHGLSFQDVANFEKNEFDLVIIPDASMEIEDAIQIRKNFDFDILVLDHHLISHVKKEDENLSLGVKEGDNYTNYCLAVNCTENNYPSPNLTGAGVVQKFIEAYVKSEGLEDYYTEQYLDLVSLGMIADSADVRDLEVRYYVLEGLKPINQKNLLLTEMVNRNPDEFTWGRTITNTGWNLAPKINGVCRYGKEEENRDLFRAMIGEKEDREYQPRRKSKYDPKPDVVIQSLQQTMARVAENVKSRQDTQVRNFMKSIEQKIEEEQLLKNSILFVDCSDIVDKKTITGLVANKLASKYFRPVVLMRSKNSLEFGGSGRGYDKGTISNFNEFLTQAGVTCMGHSNAFGILFKKEEIQNIISICNQMLPLDQLCTIHTVDWEIKAKDLRKEYVEEVANNYSVFGNTVPEPVFAITDLHITADKITGYGDSNTFIRFTYNNIPFIKKYCASGEYGTMTMQDRYTFGVNKKPLILNIIGSFMLNKWEDKVIPEVKILYYDVQEDKNYIAPEKEFDMDNDLGVANNSDTCYNKEEFNEEDFIF